MDFKIRENRKPQGSKKPAREQHRALGINRRTRKRWCQGTNPTGSKKGAPPAMRPVPSPGPQLAVVMVALGGARITGAPEVRSYLQVHGWDPAQD